MSFNFAEMFQAAQRMKEDMDKVQKTLENKVVTGVAAGGQVSVTMNGQQKILNISIHANLLTSDNQVPLQNFIIEAFTEAQSQVARFASEEMGKIREGLPQIPGLNFPF